MSTKKSLPKKIKASLELQQKVGTGAIDQKKVDDAQKVMDENKVEFAPLARPQLDLLQKAIDAAKAPGADPVESLEGFKEPIMNLKANAGSFNYKFVSQLTGNVLMFLEGVEEADGKIIQIVDVLHKTILLALAYQMKGDGGASGGTLLKAFETLCRKYKPAKK